MTEQRKPPIVCICGKMETEDDAIQVWRLRLTLQGYVVLGPEIPDSSELSDGTREAMAALQRAKIDLADFVFVVCDSGGIPVSVEHEVEYASEQAMTVRYSIQNPQRWVDDPAPATAPSTPPEPSSAEPGFTNPFPETEPPQEQDDDVEDILFIDWNDSVWMLERGVKRLEVPARLEHWRQVANAMREAQGTIDAYKPNTAVTTGG